MNSPQYIFFSRVLSVYLCLPVLAAEAVPSEMSQTRSTGWHKNQVQCVVPCTATSQIRAHRVRGSHTLSRVFVAYFFRHRHHRRIRCLCSLHLLVHTECSKRLSDGNQCEGRGSIRKINATTKPKTLRPKLTRQPQCTRWLLVHICVGAGSRRRKSKQRCGLSRACGRAWPWGRGWWRTTMAEALPYMSVTRITARQSSNFHSVSKSVLKSSSRSVMADGFCCHCAAKAGFIIIGGIVV